MSLTGISSAMRNYRNTLVIFAFSGGDDQLAARATRAQRRVLREQQSNDRGVRERAPREVDEEMASKRGEYERKPVARGVVVLAVQRHDRRSTA